ncbi:DNA polymerase III subunit theta [Serratia ficaria]|jgi:DNA polymerase-3 subunit theta|uniref:DNA polymerase III subunit theta n=1 Tax=Serratia ficaria TaxID=61651 RepID=A0A240C5T2_SERFI|nr:MULTISPECIES: DNA polymerase III subunit theta [Serratia]MEE4481402.1 DNA polymerase III subunit theta [Serratia ficaria]REF43915.1 DNA polymerase-3 subunit theta [Serratia ficaria]CAI0718538.1 DNA polymerase III subunit theta [Serratia ficaria]CAI0720947.1 DNA polymerase III subunit theta [Serratia ficaria]CAI0739615.1 DNA polymerase III subunit theta [Serratia ficaria]
MTRKLDSLPQAEREKIEADLLAISVIYNERYGIASTQADAEQQVPEHLRAYFFQRLNYYRGA